MRPLAGTFTLKAGAATCTLPHDATQEEIAEAVEEIDRIRTHMAAMEEKWPWLNISVDLSPEEEL